MIYPQYIAGKYRTLKDYSSILLLLLYFIPSWIRWDRGDNMPSQAIFMDLPNRKAYFFSIEIWPEEAYYLAGVLIMAALGLFFITSLYGRIWCGYTCPHTVFVDLFVKIERLIQGDRNARIRLNSTPMDFSKFKKKFLTHIAWIFISFGFAFGWVCYFYNAPTLLQDVLNFSVTPGGLSWLVGLTLSTYLFAGFVREKVCTYICPYGRFQSAMLDHNSSVVTYHSWRGEPRGKFDPNDNTLGDCIDCKKCVVVCPMGIDIRKGLQLACIGCGLCIDACDSVMKSINRPLGLIAYDSINSTIDLQKKRKHKKKIIQPKTVIFGIVFITAMSGLIYSLNTKSLLKITIMHDRTSLFTALPDGYIRNTYELKLYNRTSQTKQFSMTIEGIKNAELKLQGISEYAQSHFVSLQPEEGLDIIFFVRVAGTEKISRNRIIVNLTDIETGMQYKAKAKFILK